MKLILILIFQIEQTISDAFSVATEDDEDGESGWAVAKLAADAAEQLPAVEPDATANGCHEPAVPRGHDRCH